MKTAIYYAILIATIFTAPVFSEEPYYSTITVSSRNTTPIQEKKPRYINQVRNHTYIPKHDYALRNLQYVAERNQFLRTYAPKPDAARIAAEFAGGVQDSFAKRGFWEQEWTDDIPKSDYGQAFCNKILREYGDQYNNEQLARAQYQHMRRWKDYCYQGFREFIKEFPLYEEYVLALDKELSRDVYVRERVKETEYAAYVHINEEACRIKTARARAARQRIEK